MTDKKKRRWLWVLLLAGSGAVFGLGRMSKQPDLVAVIPLPDEIIGVTIERELEPILEVGPGPTPEIVEVIKWRTPATLVPDPVISTVTEWLVSEFVGSGPNPEQPARDEPLLAYVTVLGQ